MTGILFLFFYENGLTWHIKVEYPWFNHMSTYSRLQRAWASEVHVKFYSLRWKQVRKLPSSLSLQKLLMDFVVAEVRRELGK